MRRRPLKSRSRSLLLVASGLLPALAALELLLYPGDGQDRPKRPGASSSFCLFVWGAERVVPVRVVQLEIREQMFDTRLHPIRAEADLTLEVLSEAILSKIPRARKYMSDIYEDQTIACAGKHTSTGR